MPDEPGKSDDITPDEPGKSDDITPDKPEDIIMGPERGFSSLSQAELSQVSNDKSKIAAVLPEITVNISDYYAFNDVKLDSGVPDSWVLAWNPFARDSVSEVSASASDNEAVFTDSDGYEIKTVPADRIINVSAYLESGKTYAPVISANEPEGKEPEKENEEHEPSSLKSSGGGGCSSVCSAAIMLSVLCMIRRKKH